MDHAEEVKKLDKEYDQVLTRKMEIERELKNLIQKSTDKEYRKIQVYYDAKKK